MLRISLTLLFLRFVLSQKPPIEDRLAQEPVFVTQQDLIDYCGLSSEVPNADRVVNRASSNSQQVRSHFTIDHFVGIDDVGETFVTVGNLVFKWDVICYSEDFYKLIEFTSADLARGTRLFAKSWQDIFKPRIRLRNSIGDSSMVSDFNIYLEMRCLPQQAPRDVAIEFTWTLYGRFETTCSLELTKFPFDSQRCTLDLATHSALVNISEANITLGFLGSAVVSANSAWTMKGSDVKIIPSRNGRPSQAIYGFTFSRRSGYYVFNMMVPCLVLTVMELIAFALPSSMPERSTYSVSIVLALVFMLSLVLYNIPKTPQRIFLTDYILLKALLCALCTVESILLCCFTRGYPEKANATLSDLTGKSGKWISTLPLHRLIDSKFFSIVMAAFLAINAYGIWLANFSL